MTRFHKILALCILSVVFSFNAYLSAQETLPRIPRQTTACIYVKDFKKIIRQVADYSIVDTLIQMNTPGAPPSAASATVNQILSSPLAQLAKGNILLGSTLSPVTAAQTQKGIFLVIGIQADAKTKITELIGAHQTMGVLKRVENPELDKQGISTVKNSKGLLIHYFFTGSKLIASVDSETVLLMKRLNTSPEKGKQAFSKEASDINISLSQDFFASLPLAMLLNGKLKNPVVRYLASRMKIILESIKTVDITLDFNNAINFKADIAFADHSKGLTIVRTLQMKDLPVEVHALSADSAFHVSMNLDMKKILSNPDLESLIKSREKLKQVILPYTGFNSLDKSILRNFGPNVSFIITPGTADGQSTFDFTLFLQVNPTEVARTEVQTALTLISGLIQTVAMDNKGVSIVHPFELKGSRGISIDILKVMKPEQQENWLLKAKKIYTLLMPNGLIVSTSGHLLQSRLLSTPPAGASSPLRWTAHLDFPKVSSVLSANREHLIKGDKNKSKSPEKKKQELRRLIQLMNCLETFHVTETMDKLHLERNASLKLKMNDGQ